VTRSLTVKCCYCAFPQPCPEPPVLIDCAQCRRPFRALRNEGQRSVIELGPDAKRYYQRSKGVA
jgi:hypothetical protein